MNDTTGLRAMLGDAACTQALPGRRRLAAKVLTTAFVLVALFGARPAAARGPENAAHNLLEADRRGTPRSTAAGESVHCTLTIPGGVSLFGIDRVGEANPSEFIGNEIAAPFRVFQFDENCSLITSWSTVFPGLTMTGITFVDETPARGGSDSYWATNPSGSINGYQMSTGTPTGVSVILPGTILLPGPLALDPDLPGKIAYIEDIVSDVVHEIDLDTGVFGCTFDNPDNTGAGSFGNGMSDAAAPNACGGSTLVMSSGTIAEGQVTRVSQLDCSGPLCRDTWDLVTPLMSSGETFVNDIEEFVSASDGTIHLMAVGNATGTYYNLTRPGGASDCQGIDTPDSDVLYVNSSRGGLDYTVETDATAPLSFVIQTPPAGGNGKFVAHLNHGRPDRASITTLPASLGDSCFDFFVAPGGNGSPDSVFNRIGKTELVGSSSYFGTPSDDPPKAPSFFLSLAGGDIANIPSGSEWTLQAVISNPTATSSKGVSVTNAVVIAVAAQ